MILSSGDKIAIGSVLINNTNNTEWVVIKFDECEDPYFSQAMVVSTDDMDNVNEYMKRTSKRYYPFNNFKSIEYINGYDWEDYEKSSNLDYISLFKPVLMLEFKYKEDFYNE